MPLFISQTPLPFDFLLPSVSADLCVLGIQLEERTERVTASLNPAPAPLSTPRGAEGSAGPASPGALHWALRGLAALWGWGWGILQMGPEVMLVNVTSQWRVEGGSLLRAESSMGKRRKGGLGAGCPWQGVCTLAYRGCWGKQWSDWVIWFPI